MCLALTATFAVFRPPAAPAQQGVPVAHTAQSGVDQIGEALPLVFVPSASNAQLRPARIPPLRFQIAVDNGAPVPSSVTPTSYPRACACSHET